LFIDHNVHRLLTDLPYFPFQIILGLWFGWALSRHFRHRSMLWVWILPLALLCFAFADLSTVSSLGFRLRLMHFFAQGCQPENRCVDQLVITMPFYASVSYSLGAFLARRISKVHIVESAAI
jgi:hypothetical protein